MKEKWRNINSSYEFVKYMDNEVCHIQDVLLQKKIKCNALICGAMLAFDEDLIKFLNKLSNKLDNAVLLSEALNDNKKILRHLCFPHIIVPSLLAKDVVLPNLSIYTTIHMQELCKKNEMVHRAVDNFLVRHIFASQSYAVAWAYYSYFYIKIILEELKPQIVVLWNKYYDFHYIIEGLCNEKNIKTIYMEYGSLPGTISIDANGQQGESYPALNSSDFQGLIINENELFNAKKIIEYIKSSGLNRYLQSNNDKFFINHNGRKNIVYFGDNDFESGIYPYDLQANERQSPFFKSTREAFDYISLLCIKNSWNLLFKPHPIMVNELIDVYKENENYKTIIDGNINSIIDCSDVIITILSQCAYISLIREKPVVLLGNSPLKLKGCSYDPNNYFEIESCIKCAIEYGFTQNQRDEFIIHVAQLTKYYLYDDLKKKKMHIGKNIKENNKYIRNLLNI